MFSASQNYQAVCVCSEKTTSIDTLLRKYRLGISICSSAVCLKETETGQITVLAEKNDVRIQRKEKVTLIAVVYIAFLLWDY